MTYITARMPGARGGILVTSGLLWADVDGFNANDNGMAGVTVFIVVILN